MMLTRTSIKASLIAAVCCLATFVVAPNPVQADDFGISLDVPFFRVRAHDGYYYHDNDYHHNYDYRSHHYEPAKRHYYYPRRSKHQHRDHFDSWIGVHGHSYRDHHRNH